MSGALGAIGSVASALGVGGLLASPGIVIGGVQLYNFEVPDRVPWGTHMLIKEHVYPGGFNVLQAMGPTRVPITWSGLMIGPAATQRAQMLDAMAASGQVQEVSWGSLDFQAVIEQFDADYKHEWQGNYRLSLRVLWDYSQPAAAPDAVTVALSDLETATSLVPAIVGVSNALSGVISVKQGQSSVGSLSATGASIYAARTAVGQSAAGSGSTLSGATPSPSNIVALATAAGNSAQCAAAFGYVARAGLNWQQVPGVASPTLLPAQARTDLGQFTGA